MQGIRFSKEPLCNGVTFPNLWKGAFRFQTCKWFWYLQKKITFVIKLSVNFQLSSGNGSGGEEVKRPLCSGSAIQPSSPLIKEIHCKICFSVWILKEGLKVHILAIHIYQLFKYNFGSDPKVLFVRIRYFKSERWAEMVKLIVCSLREFGQNAPFCTQPWRV